jgi:hypothetical protein
MVGLFIGQITAKEILQKDNLTELPFIGLKYIKYLKFVPSMPNSINWNYLYLSIGESPMALLL